MRQSKNAGGLACLPTSTSFAPADPARSVAHARGQTAYLLEAIDPDQAHAHVQRVCVTSLTFVDGWDVGSIVETRHLNGKRLPTRRIVSVVHDGELVGGANVDRSARFPHWELMEHPSGAGVPTMDELRERLVAGRSRLDEARKSRRTGGGK